MNVDGTLISDRLLECYIMDVSRLKDRGIVPTLAIILIGSDPNSLVYIRQKQKAMDRIGATCILKHYDPSATAEEINHTVDELNAQRDVHGIIIQQPLPTGFQASIREIHTPVPSKDVDGFVPDSGYPSPVAAAIILILQEIHARIFPQATDHPEIHFFRWLTSCRITVIGKGDTGGGPIIKQLHYHQAHVSVIDTKTSNPDQMIRRSDIVISAVGKSNIVRHDNIKKGAILVSVGLWKDNAGKLHGDYEEADIASKAGYFTPTPGGVGPVTIACLTGNIVAAAQNHGSGVIKL